MNSAQQQRMAAAAANKASLAARSAALALRARGGAGMGSDFGAEVSGVWEKIKKFFGFPSKHPGLPALPGAVAQDFAPQGGGGSPVITSPAHAEQIAEAVYIPYMTDAAHNAPAELPAVHTMTLGTADLVGAINATGSAIPAKMADLQAAPSAAKEAAVKAAMMRNQGQIQLLSVGALPPMQQAMARLQAQALLTQAEAIETKIANGEIR